AAFHLMLILSCRKNPAAATFSHTSSFRNSGSTPGCSVSPGRSRGNAAFSMIKTDSPLCRAVIAAAQPAGPAPRTSTSTHVEWSPERPADIRAAIAWVVHHFRCITTLKRDLDRLKLAAFIAHHE